MNNNNESFRDILSISNYGLKELKLIMKIDY